GDPGSTMDEDEARLEAVRDALGPGGRIRVDVNATWSLDQAVENIGRLRRFDLEYVEQPVATLEDMVELRRRTGVPLAADELVRLGPDPMRVVDEGAADVLIVKVQPMGGVARVLDLAARSPVPIVLSSALESSVGIYPGLLAASLIEELPYACGLGTVALIQGDPTLEPLVSFDGYLEVRRPEPDPGLLSRWRPDRERSSQMLRRLRAAAEVLT
ncbi:MAG: O-succinylbenzoate synthase, partial [Acidimicrobiia bacterium]|nr:O-succinylbenzoate synthase [Acidimicrobiia bacterium]